MKKMFQTLLLGLIFALTCNLCYAGPPPGSEVQKIEVKKNVVSHDQVISPVIIQISIPAYDVGQMRTVKAEFITYNDKLIQDLNFTGEKIALINYSPHTSYKDRTGNNNKLFKIPINAHTGASYKHYLYWSGLGLLGN